ncbi:MAG: hypothetical protein ACOY35_10665 [Bacillota bacterium]
MKIKAEKQKAFTTNTMTSGGKYDGETAEKPAASQRAKAGKQKTMK